MHNDTDFHASLQGEKIEMLDKLIEFSLVKNHALFSEWFNLVPENTNEVQRASFGAKKARS